MTSYDEEDDAMSLPPGKWYEEVIYYLQHGTRLNDTIDLRKPQLRHTFTTLYPLVIFLYAILVAVGVVANCIMIYVIFRDGLYKDQTFCYFINLALSDIVKCVVVLPVTLTIMLIQNWVFGSFLCYFLPMIQDIPMHSSMTTFVLIAFDRYRFVKHPSRNRIPAFVMATGSWLMGLCIVLPYPIYTTYVDLGTFGKDHLEGVGLCAVNLAADMLEYVRGLFILMYVVPLCLIAYLFVHMTRELERRETPLALVIYNARRSRVNSNLSSRNSQANFRYRSPNANFDLYVGELDVKKERKVQKYLTTTITVYSICLCPLMVLRLAQLIVAETYENTGHFDFTYIAIVWLGFLPTCTTPLLFINWRMTKSAKEKLRGYFRLGTRSIRRGDSEVEAEEDSPQCQGHETLRQSRGRNSSARTSEGAVSTTPVINNHRSPLLARNERML